MIKNFFRSLCLSLAFVLPLTHLYADEINPVKIELIQENETVQPGQSFWVALHFNIDKGWHSYWKNPGDSGAPPMIDWTLPSGYELVNIQWPVPEKFTVDSLVGYGYQGETYLLAQIKPSETISPESQAEIKATIKWLICNDSTCMPGSNEVKVPVKAHKDTPTPKAQSAAEFTKARASLPTALPQTQATRKNGEVQVHLTIPKSSEKSLNAHFYPAKQEVIDTDKPAELTKNLSAPTDWTLTLKTGKNENKNNDTLEGIVIITNPKNEKLFSFEVYAPITNLDNSVALADPKHPQLPNLSNAPVEFEGGIAWALLLAFVGGLLLNLMPCVLPVVSFKILSFVKMAGQDRWLTLKHGLAFGGGVLISFWTLAGAMLALQSYGKAVGWGFQLQDPLFVAILAAFLFIFSLSLFGLFELGTFFASWAGQTQADAKVAKSGFASSFFSGVLATAIATPCTGPFLGSAVGFAVTLPVFWSLLIFTSLGLGMAIPYVFLSAFPSLLSFLPKPGAWMITFKEIVGFLVLATVLWLLWVFGAQTSSQALMLMLGAFLFFALGGWIYGKWGTPFVKRRTRLISYAFVIACLVAGTYGVYRATSPQMVETTNSGEIADGWEPFSPQRVEELRKQGTPVLIDFTAKWCLICQANHIVLSTDSTSKALSEAGVVKMKADWTKNDPVITEALKKFGRNSVPLYVLYSSDPQEPPKILPQVLTPEIVTQHLDDLEIAEK